MALPSVFFYCTKIFFFCQALFLKIAHSMFPGLQRRQPLSVQQLEKYGRRCKSWAHSTHPAHLQETLGVPIFAVPPKHPTLAYRASEGKGSVQKPYIES